MALKRKIHKTSLTGALRPDFVDAWIPHYEGMHPNKATDIVMAFLDADILIPDLEYNGNNYYCRESKEIYGNFIFHSALFRIQGMSNKKLNEFLKAVKQHKQSKEFKACVELDKLKTKFAQCITHPMKYKDDYRRYEEACKPYRLVLREYKIEKGY